MTATRKIPSFPRVLLRLGKNPHNAYEAYRETTIPYLFPSESVSPTKDSPLVLSLKRAAWQWYTTLNPIPTLPFASPQSVDLIHSTNNMLLSTSTPWVVDCEYVGAFLGFDYTRLPFKRRKLTQIIASPNCRGILFWSEAAKHSFTAFIQDSSLAQKCHVVYPTVPPKKNVRPRKSISRFLFVGSPFFEKGGKETLAAFQQAYAKNPRLSLTVVSNPPAELTYQYQNLPITFLPPTQSRTQMNDLYRSHDAFILPTFKDSYGIVFLEALSHALPVITTDMFACPELITHQKTGIIVPAPFNAYTKDFFFDTEKYHSWDGFSYYCQTTHVLKFEGQLAQAMKQLAGKKGARYSKNALADYRKRFSVACFDQSLRRAYQAALHQQE